MESGEGALSELDSFLAQAKPGDGLDSDGRLKLQQIMQVILTNANQRIPPKRLVTPHDNLKYLLGAWLERMGHIVAYEVPFSHGGFGLNYVKFDVVAEFQGQQRAIEVKNGINTRDLGQVQGYSDILQLNNAPVHLSLADWTLVLPELLEERLNFSIRKLMEREKVGIVLADTRFFVNFDNPRQLALEEMPQVLVSPEPVNYSPR